MLKYFVERDGGHKACLYGANTLYSMCVYHMERTGVSAQLYVLQGWMWAQYGA